MGSPFKMNPKTPFMKALVGKQGNLPQHLQDAIKAAPAKSYGKSPMKKTTDPKKKKPLTDAEIEAGMWKGSTEVVGKPYEGKAFVGTTGDGKRQPVGKQVSGVTEERGGTKNETGVYVTGKVQPKSTIGSSQTSVIKGQTTEIKRATRPSDEKKKAKGKSPAKMIGNYKMTSIKQKVKRNAKK